MAQSTPRFRTSPKTGRRQQLINGRWHNVDTSQSPASGISQGERYSVSSDFQDISGNSVDEYFISDIINDDSVTFEDVYDLVEHIEDAAGEISGKSEKGRFLIVRGTKKPSNVTETVIHDKQSDRNFLVRGRDDGWDGAEFYSAVEVYPHTVSVPRFVSKNTRIVRSPALREVMEEIKKVHEADSEWIYDKAELYLDRLYHDNANDDINVLVPNPDDEEDDYDSVISPVVSSTNGEYENNRQYRTAYIIEDKQTGEAISIPFSYHSEYGTDVDLVFDNEGNLIPDEIFQRDGSAEWMEFSPYK